MIRAAQTSPGQVASMAVRDGRDGRGQGEGPAAPPLGVVALGARDVSRRAELRALGVRVLVGVGSLVIAAAMLLVAVVLTVGVPVGALYLGSLLSGPQPRLPVYLLVLAAIALGAVPCVKALGVLDRWHCRLTGRRRPRRRGGGLKADCDDCAPASTLLLDWVLILVVVVVSTALLVWYFGFAHV